MISPKSKIPFFDADTRPLEEIQRYSFGRRVLRRIWLKVRTHLVDAAVQIYGMCGLFHTYRRTAGWAWRLFWGGIQRHEHAPVSRIPMRDVGGQSALHALPGQPLSQGPVPMPATRQRKDP